MENKTNKLNFKLSKHPKVSVCMITYAHENYIEEAIYGVLMQECNFEIELILSNDCSADNTDSVIQKILKNHPKASIIKYFKQEKNLGMMSNFQFALEHCNGNYIAVCEGDDFWTDRFKLQKQVDFLQNNPDCSLCFHNATVYEEETQKSKLFIENYTKKFYTANDILLEWLIPSASVLFVNFLKENKLPDFFPKAMHGDLLLQLSLFEYGKFGLINENMCTYRINQSSVTKTIFNNLEYKYAYIDQLIQMKKYFRGKYDSHFDITILVQIQNILNFYKTQELKKQLLVLLKLKTFKIQAIRKNSNLMWYTIKIFLHNTVDRLRTVHIK